MKAEKIRQIVRVRNQIIVKMEELRILQDMLNRLIHELERMDDDDTQDPATD